MCSFQSILTPFIMHLQDRDCKGTLEVPPSLIVCIISMNHSLVMLKISAFVQVHCIIFQQRMLFLGLSLCKYVDDVTLYHP